MGAPIGVQLRVVAKLEAKAVEDATKKGAFKNLTNAAASIRKSAIASMPYAKGPSEPGNPPHAHKGRLRKSILFDVDSSKGTAVVGPSYDAMQSGGLPPWVGSMHERGGTFTGKKGKTKKYPKRPFMQPALERAKPRLAAFWANSIKP
jgi:hypothetical protein